MTSDTLCILHPKIALLEPRKPFPTLSFKIYSWIKLKGRLFFTPLIYATWFLYKMVAQNTLRTHDVKEGICREKNRI